jgi:hypothetical protein
MELFGIEKTSRITGVTAAKIRYWLESGDIEMESAVVDGGKGFPEEGLIWIWLLSLLRDRGCPYRLSATIARSIARSAELSSANFILASSDGDGYSAHDTAEDVADWACAMVKPVVIVKLSVIRNSVRRAIGPTQTDIPIGVAEPDMDGVEI